MGLFNKEITDNFQNLNLLPWAFHFDVSGLGLYLQVFCAFKLDYWSKWTLTHQLLKTM